MLKKWIEKAFARTELQTKGRSKKLEKIEVPPAIRFVYFMQFAFLALICLVALQIVDLAIRGYWNSEIFAVITSLIGTIIGCFVGAKA